MKKTFSLAALIVLALAAFALTTAAEEVIERKIVLKIAADGDVLDLDLSDLEVGASQQLFTGDGKLVVVTRNEDEYVIEVEGRDEPIVVPAGGHGHAYAFETECADGDSDCEHNVTVDKHIVMHSGDGSGSHRMIFISDDDEVHHLGDGDGHHWVQHDGDGDGVHVIRVGAGAAAAERLLASGALDDLDEAKRQEILDALRAEDHGKMKVKIQKRIHRHDDDQ